MKNAPASFQQLINKIIRNLESTEYYIDDVVIYSDSWEQHTTQFNTFFERVSKASLTINLVKRKIGDATDQYLGHPVSRDKVRPMVL